MLPFPTFINRRILIIAASAVGLIIFLSILFPLNFKPTDVSIVKGMTSHDAALALKEKKVISSSFLLRVILKLSGAHVLSGEYHFGNRDNIFKVASRITNGDFGRPQVQVTIPEGSTNIQIAEAIKATYPNFNDKEFLAKASGKQGYLFPDTYYFESTSTDLIISTLTDHFDLKVRFLQATAESEGRNWHDIVVMASILEEEANNPEDFALVSGILWKRIEIGMALQVDVDLNTYKEPGLPAEPLSNPGLDTLTAAMYPSESTHLFYLTGNDGLMHYAEDFEEHKANVQKYLR